MLSFKKQHILLLCLCASTLNLQSSNDKKDPIWNPDLCTELLHTSEKVAQAIMIQPDEDEEALKKRVLYLLVYEQPLLETLIRTAEILKTMPVNNPEISFDPTLFITSVDSLLAYIRALSLDELTNEELQAIEKLQETTRVLDVNAFGPLGQTPSVALLNNGWKIILALGVFYLMYRVIEGARAKRSIDNEEYMLKLSKLSESDKKVFAALEKKVGQLIARAEKNEANVANLSKTRNDLEGNISTLKKLHPLMQQLLQDTQEARHSFDVRSGPKQSSLYNRIFGKDETTGVKPKRKKSSKN